ncbi:MAG TPA: HlyD family efflux transporter periplasmic adaptor subunit [Polyangiales bacterium]|nr:HlyD family efflux transporter periplasmic adaptor subunit [Polyangiales bacterium]
MRRAVVLAAVGGGLFSLALIWLVAQRETARVDRGPIGESILGRAMLVADDSLHHVFASNDGRVVRVAVRAGEAVEAGQVLAEIDSDGTHRELAAPQRGVVLERRCEVGDFAHMAEYASGPLFVLADPAQSELSVEVEEADAAALSPGLRVWVSRTGESETRVAGKVTRVAAQLTRRSIGTDDARVRADGWVRKAAVAFEGARPGWPLGTRADALIELRRKNAAARVPRSALAVRDGRNVVEQPVAFWTREVAVDVVSVDDAYAEVRGLEPGSEVVVLGDDGAR